jgi:hypothetical protein
MVPLSLTGRILQTLVRLCCAFFKLGLNEREKTELTAYLKSL